MTTIPKLETLKQAGQITEYKLHNVSEAGIVGERSPFRNTQLLLLRFPNGDTIEIQTLCSGTAEDSILIFFN
jgi:hypothetical protein